jgi:hypothetical protein
MVVDEIGCELVDGAIRHTSSLLENPEVARHTPREAQLLFDQQQREAGRAVQRQQDVADLVDEVGLNPSVGSSRIRSDDSRTSARAIASCCCWPPERSPPRRCRISFSTGNRS